VAWTGARVLASPGVETVRAYWEGPVTLPPVEAVSPR
jgi:hypothetical protein